MGRNCPLGDKRKRIHFQQEVGCSQRLYEDPKPVTTLPLSNPTVALIGNMGQGKPLLPNDRIDF